LDGFLTGAENSFSLRVLRMKTTPTAVRMLRFFQLAHPSSTAYSLFQVLHRRVIPGQPQNISLQAISNDGIWSGVDQRFG
jgi:hypothetical protein